MQNQITEYKVVVSDPDLLDDLLTEAEALLRPVAMVEGRVGILVTRHALGRYTVALDEAVPFGETYERTIL